MASVFKRTYTTKDGRVAEYRSYTVGFVDRSNLARGAGVVRQVLGFTHKGASEDLGRALDKLVTLRAAREPLPEDLRLHSDGLPIRIRRKLAGWGLLAGGAGDTLADSLAAYQQALRDGVASRKQKGRPATPDHVQLTSNRIRALLTGMGATTFTDMTPTTVGRALRTLQEKGQRKKGIGAKSAAHYYGAIYAFLTWVVREKMVPENR